MCLVVFIFNDSNLELYMNREEDYKRETISSYIWKDKNIIAGQDNVYKGTWLGINYKNFHFIALTNCLLEYENTNIKPTKSKGQIPIDYLESNMEPVEFIKEKISCNRFQYKPFNLLLGTKIDNKLKMYYYQ